MRIVQYGRRVEEEEMQDVSAESGILIFMFMSIGQ